MGLLALAGMLALKAKSFPEHFSAAQVNVVPGEKIDELDLTVIKKAEVQVEQPATWEVKKGANPFMFVPDLYVISERGQPEKPGIGSRYSDSLTGKPIPNVFFTSNSLPLLDPSVPKQDPDKDGFTNEDEWRGMRDGADPTKWQDGTNPNDAASHPPFITKLFFKQWIRVRFRLLFQAYDGDPTKPAEMSFQINAIDRGRKTEFLKLGQKVANTNYKLEKFEFKKMVNPSTGAETDVSELTVVNTEFNEPVVLIMGKETDSPESSGLLEYQITGKDLAVKRQQPFVLLPEKDKLYKLVDIKEGQALIQPPDGGTYLVTPDPRKK